MNTFRTGKGGRIRRDRPLDFSFGGKTLSGFEGDSLASALLANGIHFVARSYKYHRPRGILSAGAEEPNALVQLERGKGRIDPNVRATTQPLYQGLCARPQHCWPSLAVDLGAMAGLGGNLFAAGFYYKTFMWPPALWKKLYEPLLRLSAGLGRAPTAPDPDSYTARYAHCDVLVAGGGPAGIMAALNASKSGARVILADEQDEFGGALLSMPNTMIGSRTAWDWLEETLGELRSRDNVTLLPRTSVFGYYEDNMLGLVQKLTDHLSEPPAGMPRERLWRVRAKKTVLATGAIERPLVFCDNDRPGVMLAGAGAAYLGRYGVRVGNSVLVATCHDSAYHNAFELARAGMGVAAIVDMREKVAPDLLDTAGSLNIEVLCGHEVKKTSGRRRIRSADISPRGQPGPARTIACDCLLMGGGWTPSVHLFSQSRGKLKWNGEIGAPVPDTYVQNAVSVGACNGKFSLSDILGQPANAKRLTNGWRKDRGENLAISPQASEAERPAAFTDFQHDVTTKDIELSLREGFSSIEHLKRYTTTGMATDQGKTSNVNTARLAAHRLEQPEKDIGLTTFRPPYTPVGFGTLAGHRRGALFDAVRKTPSDEWARRNGGVFEPVGQWQRTFSFVRPGEDTQHSIARECLGTRNALGLCDVSTLGKIEITGPDAARFLDRFYLNPLEKLSPGRCRYVLALREDGTIYDDGIVARLDERRFHVTTTTGGVQRVFANMQDYLQTEWSDLKAWATPITEQWATFALSGPRVQEFLAPLVEGFDFASEAFAHMSVRTGTIFGVEARIFRVSFTGETGFEINVPTRYGPDLWQRLIDAGERFGLTPYGTGALMQMRMEKGYIIVGQDTSGAQTPNDMGLDWMAGRKKSWFVGRQGLERIAGQSTPRLQLVGLKPCDPGRRLEAGAQIVETRNFSVPAPMIGHVTSTCYSATLGRTIALALVRDGRSRTGNILHVPLPRGVLEAEVVDPVFLDPEGARLHG